MKPLLNIKGNTCYINCVLQIFLSNSEFITKLVHSKFGYNSLLYYLIEIMVDNSHVSSPKNFILLLQKRLQRNLFIQSDSHEILLDILDQFKTENAELIDTFFNGRINNTFTCSKCKIKRVKIESFITIPLYCSQSTCLKQSIEEYLKVECIDDSFCEHCKCNTVTYKKIKVETYPKILIFNLIRFTCDNRISHANNISFTKAKINYNFQGVINHHGHDLNSGHYIYSSDKMTVDDSTIYKTKYMTPKDHYLFIYNIN